MRAFIAQDRDDVMRQARESTERRRAGQPRSVLEGVPIAVKDEVDQVPYPTTVGTRVHGRVPALRDATVVARLRAAGAVLIGKTNMHEIGIGVTGLNPHHGTARNPHDPSRHTGGSSSGSAAAVALGLCPAAVAADGGGSIRIPAAFCGLVGLKPTFGRVSEHGAAPLCWSVAHLGPIAATSEDAALLYAVMAGADAADPLTLGQPDAHLDGIEQLDLGGVRIGVDGAWFDDADSEVVAPCREALAVLERAGAELVDVSVSEVDLCRLAHLVTIGTEMTASQEPFFGEHLHAYGSDTQLLFSLVSCFPPTLYIAAQRARARVCFAFNEILQGVDVLATPTTGCVAPEVSRRALATGESNLVLFDRIMRFAPVANLTGLPAVSVPAGYAGHLPVGLQLLGRPWQEHLLLRLCRVVERGVQRRQPRVHFRALG
jgi:Asp-tRNA(Asn)/Glu-tRNA(Gln) amidotransferase A subunit family amidase